MVNASIDLTELSRQASAIKFWYNPLTPWLIILGLLILFLIGYLIYRVWGRDNRVLRIHMPDKKVRSHIFKKNIGKEVSLPTLENDGLGHPIPFTYYIKDDCWETGYWGLYMDFDYKVAEPINPASRDRKTSYISELVSQMLNSNLAQKLLTNTRFEGFVRSMMTVLIIIAGLTLVGVIAGFFIHTGTSTCVLTPDNSTLNTIYIGAHMVR